MLGVVKKDGSYLGVPDRYTRIEAGDTAILYGRDARFAELTDRQVGAEGDRAHQQAIAPQQAVDELERTPDT